MTRMFRLRGHPYVLKEYIFRSPNLPSGLVFLPMAIIQAIALKLRQQLQVRSISIINMASTPLAPDYIRVLRREVFESNFYACRVRNSGT